MKVKHIGGQLAEHLLGPTRKAPRLVGRRQFDPAHACLIEFGSHFGPLRGPRGKAPQFNIVPRPGQTRADAGDRGIDTGVGVELVRNDLGDLHPRVIDRP